MLEFGGLPLWLEGLRTDLREREVKEEKEEEPESNLSIIEQKKGEKKGEKKKK